MVIFFVGIIEEKYGSYSIDNDWMDSLFIEGFGFVLRGFVKGIVVLLVVRKFDGEEVVEFCKVMGCYGFVELFCLLINYSS